MFPIVGVGAVVISAIGPDGPIEGIDARTGVTVWSHPAGEGRPMGATAGMVVELTEENPTTPAGGPPSRMATLRAVDAGSGSEVWTREVDVFERPLGMGSLNGVEIMPATVGNGYVAVPGPGVGLTPMATLVIDASTGAEIAHADGVIAAAATDQVLSEWRWSADGRQPEVAYYQVATGASLSVVPGVSPVYPLAPTRTWGAQGTGTLVWVTGDVTSAAEQYWAVVDAADGRQVWRVDDGAPVGWDDTTVLNADGPKLALHDAATGTVLWHTDTHEPGGLVNAGAAAFGSDLIVVDVDKMAGD